MFIIDEFGDKFLGSGFKDKLVIPVSEFPRATQLINGSEWGLKSLQIP